VDRQSDAGNFITSSPYKLLERREANVPPDSELPGKVLKVSFAGVEKFHAGSPVR
jgi:hypothetical protein